MDSANIPVSAPAPGISVIQGSVVHRVSHLLVFKAEKEMYPGDNYPYGGEAYLPSEICTEPFSAYDDPETIWKIKILLPSRDQVYLFLEKSNSVIEAHVRFFEGVKELNSATRIFKRKLNRQAQGFSEPLNYENSIYMCASIPHGAVTCRFDIVYRRACAPVAPYYEFPPVCRETLGTIMLRSSNTSDITLVVNDKEWKLHKCILSSRSSVFAAMFACEMKEKIEGSVQIKDVNSDAFELMIRYIYTDFVGNIEGIELEVLALADRYDVSALKEICEELLCCQLNAANALTFLQMADLYRASKLRELAKRFAFVNLQVLLENNEIQELEKHNASLFNEILRMSISK